MTAVDLCDAVPTEPSGSKVPDRTKLLGQFRSNHADHRAIVFASLHKLDRSATICFAGGFQGDKGRGVDHPEFFFQGASHIGDGTKCHLAQECWPVQNVGRMCRVVHDLAGFKRNDLGHIAGVDPATDFVSLEFDFSDV